jgi:putative heme-binding domain-containing protein
MGTHGTGELLTAIVDPNAEVDPSFVTWNIETKDGQSYAGIIASENPTSITLKSLAGVQEVKTANIKSRVNTGRSLMPEGFEGLGGEQIRDIIAYMQSVDGGKFRSVDLSKAFTANTNRGLYLSERNSARRFEVREDRQRLGRRDSLQYWSRTKHRSTWCNSRVGRNGRSRRRCRRRSTLRSAASPRIDCISSVASEVGLSRMGAKARS